jgi:hypothetical protein
MSIVERTVSASNIYLLRPAPNSDQVWPRLHADEFVVLVVTGLNYKTYIRCDSIEDAVSTLEATAFTALSQYFAIAEDEA